MARIALAMSRKVVFGILLAVCLLGICFVYFADINVMTSRPVVIAYSHLERLALKWPSNNNNNSSSSNNNNISSSSSSISSSSSNNNNNNNNSSNNNTEERKVTSLKEMDVFSSTTKMTFDTSLVVACKKSQYIQCVPPNVKPIPGKVFKVVYVGRPFWISRTLYKMASCQVKQCSFSDGPVANDTDVIIIFGTNLRDRFQLPKRWPNQTYILSEWESPVNSGSDVLYNGDSPWNARINLIMSYRVDSDVFVPYSTLRFSPRPLKDRPNYYEIAKKKTGTAVWLVTRCSVQSRRWQYVQEMQKYIDVDILGGCGRPCSRASNNCDSWNSKYKFYLSFENSLCTDYVTEKFFKIFDHNIPVIPVVRGGADYDKHFPNFTYINSAHFKTPKDLALHLKDLAADLDTYSKYLEYKDLYVYNVNIDQFCTLCSFLHTHTLPDTKTYNLKAWMNDGHCHDAKDL